MILVSDRIHHVFYLFLGGCYTRKAWKAVQLNRCQAAGCRPGCPHQRGLHCFLPALKSDGPNIGGFKLGFFGKICTTPMVFFTKSEAVPNAHLPVQKPTVHSAIPGETPGTRLTSVDLSWRNSNREHADRPLDLGLQSGTCLPAKLITLR
jgi:hypothetical protein